MTCFLFQFNHHRWWCFLKRFVGALVEFRIHFRRMVILIHNHGGVALVCLENRDAFAPFEGFECQTCQTRYFSSNGSDKRLRNKQLRKLVTNLYICVHYISVVHDAFNGPIARPRIFVSLRYKVCLKSTRFSPNILVFSEISVAPLTYH